MPTAVEDKDAIREVLAEYCFRLDGGRFDEMAALFTEDGTWDTAFGSATGRPAIAAQAARPAHRPAATAPARHPPDDQHRDQARRRRRPSVRSNWMVATNSPEGPKIGSGGGYADEMVKTADGWLFKVRKIDRFIKAD